MRLRQKLLLAALPAVLTLAGLSAYAATIVDQLGGSAENILHANYKSIRVVQRMNELRADIERLFLAPDGPVDLGHLEARIAEFEAELATQLGNVTEPGEEEATARQARAFRAWAGGVRLTAARPAGQAQVQAASAS